VKRPLVDVNVVLDAVLERSPHSEAAVRLWAAVETKRIQTLVPAHGVTTIFYLLAREKGATSARRVVRDLLAVFGVAAVDQAVLQRALALGWPDFEDAVCAAAAEPAGCDVIVTRDPKGFPDSSVPAVDTLTAVALLAGGGPGQVWEPEAGPYSRDRAGRKPLPPRRGRRRAARGRRQE
jgi:predicted nucleic acid-binding protein